MLQGKVWNNQHTHRPGNSRPLVHPRMFCDSVGAINTLPCPFSLFCPYILPISQYSLPSFDVDLYLRISIHNFPLFVFWFLQTSLRKMHGFPNQGLRCCSQGLPGSTCNDKTVEHVDVMMMFIDKLEGAAYRHPR